MCPSLLRGVQDAGLAPLVDWDIQRELQLKISELEAALFDMLQADPPASASECLAMVKAKKTENEMPDADVLLVVVRALLRSINLTGKNQQQISQSILAKLKTHHKLLSTFATNTKTELALLNTIQASSSRGTRACMHEHQTRSAGLYRTVSMPCTVAHNGERSGHDSCQSGQGAPACGLQARAHACMRGPASASASVPQVYCYEDSRLLKVFMDIVKILYNAEILAEDTIQYWYKKVRAHASAPCMVALPVVHAPTGPSAPASPAAA